jgi:hypothetical protein
MWNGILPSAFETEIFYAFLSSFMHVTCYAHNILLSLDIITISPSSCHFVFLSSKSSPEHFVFEYIQSMLFCLAETQNIFLNYLESLLKSLMVSAILNLDV